MFIENLWKQPQLYVTWCVLAAFSICVHELSHAWVAWTQGDSTAADRGYVTLNPLRLMGPYSLMFLAFFGLAWGAVPVDPRRMRNGWSRGVVAFAGPGANLLLVALLAGFLWATGRFGGAATVSAVMVTGIQINLLLFLFNLLPIPILDGWEVLGLFVPATRRMPLARSRQFGMIALIVIMFSGMIDYLWAVARQGTWLIAGWVG